MNLFIKLICKWFNLIHRSRQICWHCRSEMIWNCDFDYQDYGLDGEGIISTFSCSNPNCPVSSEVYYPINENN